MVCCGFNNESPRFAYQRVYATPLRSAAYDAQTLADIFLFFSGLLPGAGKKSFKFLSYNQKYYENFCQSTVLNINSRST
jgi:hypothetical protein